MIQKGIQLDGNIFNLFADLIKVKTVLVRCFNVSNLCFLEMFSHVRGFEISEGYVFSINTIIFFTYI